MEEDIRELIAEDQGVSLVDDCKESENFTKILCFYHSRDLDGLCSAAIVRKKYPHAKFYGIDYGDTFPDEMVDQDTVVIMVDFSLHIQAMIELAARCHLIWIDHHISAIKDAAEYDFRPYGLYRSGEAGCELSWQYFFPDAVMPRSVRYLGRYDVWDKKDPQVDWFQLAVRSLGLTIDDPRWFTFFHDTNWTDELCGLGFSLQEYQDVQNAELCKHNAYEVRFEGYTAIALNGGLGSPIFKSVWDPKKYDMMITFSTNGKIWRVSLYQDGRPDVDCSVIAKKHGGGGHAGAAGFTCKELPFKVVE